MSEPSRLHDIILEIITTNVDKTLFGKDTCSLKNQDIFDKIRPKTMRPVGPSSVGRVIKLLEKKGFIKRDTTYQPCRQGMVRTITIL